MNIYLYIPQACGSSERESLERLREAFISLGWSSGNSEDFESCSLVVFPFNIGSEERVRTFQQLYLQARETTFLGHFMESAPAKTKSQAILLGCTDILSEPLELSRTLSDIRRLMMPGTVALLPTEVCARNEIQDKTPLRMNEFASLFGEETLLFPLYVVLPGTCQLLCLKNKGERLLEGERLHLLSRGIDRVFLHHDDLQALGQKHTKKAA